MPEEKRKINAWIPVSLYEKLETAGYDNVTQALIKAIESFGDDPQEDTIGYKEDITGYLQDIEGYKEDLSRIQKDLDKKDQDIIGYTQDISALNNEIERLKDDLAKAPDTIEFAKIQVKYEGLQEIIREKDRSIERLESDLQKAGQREEDLKQMHNNYMLQVQSLINARALSVPSGSTEKEEQKEEKKESRPAAKNKEKELIEKICKNPDCGKTFFTDNIQKQYCTKNCKDHVYNEKRKREKKEKNSTKPIEKTCQNCLLHFTTENPEQAFCSPECENAYNQKKK